MTMVPLIGKCPLTYFVYFAFIGLLYPVIAEDNVGIIMTSHGEIGKESNVTCYIPLENVTIEWQFQGKTLEEGGRVKFKMSKGTLDDKDRDGTLKKSTTSSVIIQNTTLDNEGNYTCVAVQKDEKFNKTETKYLDLSFEGKLVNVTKGPIPQNASDHNNVTLECIFEVYKPGIVKWSKLGTDVDNDNIGEPKQENITLKEIKSTVVVRIRNADNDDGTYVCEIEDIVSKKRLNGSVDIHVYAPPFVDINKFVAVNTTEIYVNWTVKPYRQKIKSYFLKYHVETSNLQTINSSIDVNATSFVLGNLTASTNYHLVLEVVTAYGKSESKKVVVKTLDTEPIFKPNISINGFSATSVTIGWQPAPENITSLINGYDLEARKTNDNTSIRAYHDGKNNLPYMFGNLEPHSTYIFQVRACSEMTHRCGPSSDEMIASTMDGIPSPPANFSLHCEARALRVTWEPPARPNAEIKGYMVELTGKAQYVDKNGKEVNTTWGPQPKFTSNNSREVRFEDLQPNTQYTVRLSAMTRTRRRGEERVAHCTTPRARPDLPPSPRWSKVLDNDNYYFNVYVPRVSEKNGPICCYRVFMVVVSGATSFRELSPLRPGHSHPHAYVTDIFSNKNFPPDSKLTMGDGKSHYDPAHDSMLNNKNCSRCLKRPHQFSEATTTAPTTVTVPTTTVTTPDEFLDEGDYTTDEGDLIVRDRRHLDSQNALMLGNVEEDKEWRPEDKPLDPTVDYSLYIELIPGQPEEEPLYSVYLNLLRAAPTVVPSSSPFGIALALQVTCGIAAMVLLCMIIFCIIQARRFRKPPHVHLEMSFTQSALRCIGLGGGGAAQSARLDLSPIPASLLAQAFAAKQLDSDYGFQNEFELIQSQCNTDRTTHASDARENQHKNRYPDIKAYDQTRVRLAQVDGIVGSDYINANYVIGYQERKKYICAQGPTDATVNDFWRMIWEQGIVLIVMLTNLEEYSKVKCSKYWPDEVQGVKAFGTISVQHVSEKRYSDYIVRELRISKQTPSEEQPVVESNGVAKKNGDIKEHPEWNEDRDFRIVKQYHFLIWKDFGAPEYPQSILKFIKHMNECWSSMGVSSAALVHCSAGVGRTGTLVAVDVLLDALRERRAVSVVGTVADLRRQRNFLVQSLKQYVFVYRALLEYSHFGDTEIPASRLRATVDKLRNTPEGGDKSLMEIEFEKILNSPIPEPVKSCAAGASEEVRSKNRSQEYLPYDRNRVILAPLPARDYSTYINASFIEAYDNSEGFIITQDPLPNTIMDFWRMVSEHNVSTIVMLSELGEGKCPRYWEDGTAQYEHISVQYEDSESLPYYTRRQFRVVNTKSGTMESVRQLQYVGWPTAPGSVPEVTRGVADLADLAAPAPVHTLLVHCQTGCERSPLFVCLCVLTSQLRAERRVDVCAAVRKLRAQRALTIDTFSQYEFLHRAILNYAELHNLLEDS